MIRYTLKRLCSRKPSLFLFIVIVLLYIKSQTKIYPTQRERIQSKVVKVRKVWRSDPWYKPTFDEKTQSCTIPKLDPYLPAIYSHFKKLPPLSCTAAKNWVTVSNGRFHILPPGNTKLSDVSCDYTPIHRGKDDFEYQSGVTLKNMKHGSPIPTDVFKVNCAIRNSKAVYNNIHMGISRKETLNNDNTPLPPTASGMNILMIGFDSTSHMTWLRTMNKTLNYFTNTLGGTILDGYNIVGDGTPQALLPILTGYAEYELPEARRGKRGAKPVDGHPWIWKELKILGYSTALLEDHINAGTWQYRMLGFREQPTDYYMRHFYQAASGSCFGSTPRHEVHLDLVKEFFESYPDKRKFAFTFQAEMTHGDCSLLQHFDDKVYKTLMDLEQKGHLDNTLVILMGDHGARFSNFRAVEQGKLEERMPMMSVRLPPWFRQQYPEEMHNIKTNSKRLTSPFDIHATLMDLIEFKEEFPGNTGPHYERTKEQYGERGMSLLRPIPENRTCAQASIEPHWCACLQWTVIPSDYPIIKNISKTFLDHVKKLIKNVNTLCHDLEIERVSKAVKFVPNQNLLKFKGNADSDGFVPVMSDKVNVQNAFYQLTLNTKPGGGQFEVTVTYKYETKEFILKTSDISRINKYGNDPSCIADKHPHLRQFCYCKSKSN